MKVLCVVVLRWLPLAAGIAVALLLAGCTVKVPHATQSLAIGALVDPALEPLRGCEALSGEWENQGYRVNELRIRSVILTGVLNMADVVPETAFADRLRLDMRSDGSLSLVAADGSIPMGSMTIAAANIRCRADGAELLEPAHTRLSVDADGALWVMTTRGLASVSFGHRFLPVGHELYGCNANGLLQSPVLDGMATVIVGPGDHQATIMKVDDSLHTLAVQMGKTVRAQAIYLLAGAHGFDVHVWTPGRFWTDRPQATVSAIATVEPCHVYVPVGWHREGSESWAALIDMGAGFNASCISTPLRRSDAIRFSADERKLLVEEYCFADARPAKGQVLPPREIVIRQRSVNGSVNDAGS